MFQLMNVKLIVFKCDILYSVSSLISYMEYLTFLALGQKFTYNQGPIVMFQPSSLTPCILLVITIFIYIVLMYKLYLLQNQQFVNFSKELTNWLSLKFLHIINNHVLNI